MRFILLCSYFIYVCACTAAAQPAYDFYLSNAGNDAHTGTINAPKKTIAGVKAALANAGPIPAPLKIAFRSGDVFNESYTPAFPLLAATYFPDAGSKNFAILNGAEVFNTGWQRTDSTTNIYHHDIPLNGIAPNVIPTIGQYGYIYVFEVDRQLEATAPVTARRMLKFMPALAGADAEPGSFYEPVAEPGASTFRVYIHTSNGLPPNNNPRYRYEVSVRDWGINNIAQQNNYYERLWVTGYAAGNGLVAGGGGTVLNRMIFGPGAAIHHVGLKNGMVNNSLFLPGPLNTNGYALVYYDTSGQRKRNTVKNTIFLDIKKPFYAHLGGGTRYASFAMDNVISFANPAEPMSFLECSDTDSIFLNNVYVDGHNYGYLSQTPYVSIKNSVFKDVGRPIGIIRGNIEASVFNSYMRVVRFPIISGGVVVERDSKLNLSSSIIHCKDTLFTGSYNSPVLSFVTNSIRPGSQSNITGNIFIAEVNGAYSVVAGATNIENGPATSTDTWSNNVYVLLRGQKICWRIVDSSTRSAYFVDSFSQWQALSGQDRNSLFLDLRNDPRGLKAIFTNPDSGDYSIANTLEGNAIKQIRAGMAKPISCFLNRPTYEQAADIIMNDGVLSASACRKTCLQGNLKLSNSLSSSILPNKKVQVQWYIEDAGNVQHFEIMRSFGSGGYVVIGKVPANDLTNYVFTDSSVVPGIEYRYSIAVVTNLLEKCYSSASIIKIPDGPPFNVYPNPSQGKFTIGLNGYSGKVKVTVYNVLGRVVYQKDLNAGYGFPPQINLSAEAKGMYWIKMETDKETSMKGVVLK